MNESLKEEITRKQGSEGFIKITDNPVSSLSSGQKAILNRKGNELFNKGRIEEARRVGDVYQKKNEILKALKLYVLAHNRTKTEPIYEKMAEITSVFLKEK